MVILVTVMLAGERWKLRVKVRWDVDVGAGVDVRRAAECCCASLSVRAESLEEAAKRDIHED